MEKPQEVLVEDIGKWAAQLRQSNGLAKDARIVLSIGKTFLTDEVREELKRRYGDTIVLDSMTTCAHPNCLIETINGPSSECERCEEVFCVSHLYLDESLMLCGECADEAELMGIDAEDLKEGIQQAAEGKTTAADFSEYLNESE